MSFSKSRFFALGVLFLAVGFTITISNGTPDPSRLIPEWLWRVLPARESAVAFDTASPEAEGMDAVALSMLRRNLADASTEAFIVLRHGRVLEEWYAPAHHPADKLGLAALAKGVVGSLTLAAALSDDELKLDDRVASLLPSWADDAQKSGITVRHLASHSSGLEDIDFGIGAAPPGWRTAYVANPAERFRWAADSTEFLFEPGERYNYSGVGYYVLADVIAEHLRSKSPNDAKSLYTQRVLEPLGIPASEWALSYGQDVVRDSLELYAIGSGSSFSARAVAAIGQLVLNGGTWNGQELIPAEYLSAVIDPAGSPAARELTPGEPISALGWYRNADGFWPSLPRDAIVGAGIGHQVLLVVPSLDLVMVRLGDPLVTPTIWGGGFWMELEEHLFEPLMESVTQARTTKSGAGISASR